MFRCAILLPSWFRLRWRNGALSTWPNSPTSRFPASFVKSPTGSKAHRAARVLCARCEAAAAVVSSARTTLNRVEMVNFTMIATRVQSAKTGVFLTIERAVRLHPCPSVEGCPIVGRHAGLGSIQTSTRDPRNPLRRGVSAVGPRGSDQRLTAKAISKFEGT